VALLERVMPGDIPRQHARIGRFDIPGDECQAHSRHRLHAKAFEHMDMRMPAADEYQILFYPARLLHRDTMPERGPEDEIQGRRQVIQCRWYWG
jgi:hypothetical protein